MKIVLKILGGIVVLIIAAIILVPMIFKDDLVKLVKQEANAAVNAEIEFGDFNLSLIKSFPNFFFTVEDVKVIGVGEFEGTDLASIGELDFTIDLMSIINGEEIQVKQIIIDNANIHAKVLENGKANWDIAKESKETEVVEEIQEAEEVSKFKLGLESIEISEANIVYDDLSMPVYLAIQDLNLSIASEITESTTDLQVKGGINAIDLNYENIQYINKAKVLMNLAMLLDLDAFKFTFKENEIKINELPMGLDGWLAMPEDPIEMDLTFFAKKTEFREILSMVPAEFAKELEGIETDGKFALNGYAKGTYIDSTYPAFGLDLMVENARFQYPDLPNSMEDIQIKTNIESIDGNLDNTIIDVSKFHFSIADNPFDLSFYLKNPMSDPFMKAAANGTINFDHISELVPLEKNDKLGGIVKANISMEGRVSTLENEQYEDFIAKGQFAMNNFIYTSDSLDFPVEIPLAEVIVSPKSFQLKTLSMLLGKSDVNMGGSLENFIPYALDDGQTLKGNLSIQSNLLDINELMGYEETDSSEEELESQSDTVNTEEPMETLLLPKYIYFTTTASIGKMIYEDMQIDNIKGKIALKDEKLSLENAYMDFLQGAMTMTGFYESTDSLFPSYDFAMDIKSFDVTETMVTFNSIEKLAPIAKNTKGKYSAKMKILGTLDKNMEPLYESIFGDGKISTENILVEDYKPLKKIAKAIKYDKLNPLTLNDVDVNFKITEGKVYVEPFTNKIGDSKVTIAGSNSFDQMIDYTFSFEIPRSEFGGEANDAIDGLLSQVAAKGINVDQLETINVDVKLVGPASDPKVTTDFKEAKSKATDSLKKEAERQFEKHKKELEDKAKEELEKQKKEAEEKAKQELEKQKKEAEEQLKKESEKAKKKLEEEAKKKLKGLFK